MSEEQEELKRILKKLADYLSRRSHSKKELRLKLSKKFSLKLIDQALEKAKRNNWLETEEELSEKLVASLHKKNKSWNYIKNYFYEKDLPLPPYEREKELEKATNLVSRKFGSLKELSFEQKTKLKQFLAYRGFEKTIVDDLFG